MLLIAVIVIVAIVVLRILGIDISELWRTLAERFPALGGSQ